MSFSQIIAILRARWGIVVSILSVALLSTMLLNALINKRYAATAVVMLDIKTPDSVAGMVLPGMMSPTFMATQGDVIRSQRVVERVITNLKLDVNPQFQELWQKATQGKTPYRLWLTDRLSSSLRVDPARESNVISVEYTADDPNQAAILANAFTTAFIEVSKDLRAEPARQFGTTFETLGGQLRKRLEAANAKLTQYQRDAGLMATDERLDVETQRLAELSSQVLQLQAMSADSEARQASARTRGTDATVEAANSTVISQIKSDLIRSEAQLQELRSRLGDAHPTVQQQMSTIESLRTRMNTELGRLNSMMSNSGSIQATRLAQAQAALEEQRAKLLKLKEQRADAAMLTRDVENLQRAYDVVQGRVSQSIMESASAQTNLSVIQEAIPPTTASAPKSTVNLLIALVLGSLIACATAMAVELIDRRVRSNEDVLRELGVPLVGVLLKTENAPKGLLTRKAPPWVIQRNLPFANGAR